MSMNDKNCTKVTKISSRSMVLIEEKRVGLWYTIMWPDPKIEKKSTIKQKLQVLIMIPHYFILAKFKFSVRSKIIKTSTKK